MPNPISFLSPDPVSHAPVSQVFKPDRKDMPLQPYEYNFHGNPANPADDNSFTRSITVNQSGNIPASQTHALLISQLEHRYIIMAFAAESKSRALGTVGRTSTNGFIGMNATLDLKTVWSNGNGPHEPRSFGAHKWHSAQFRSTHVLQYMYWQALVGPVGFKILTTEELAQ